MAKRLFWKIRNRNWQPVLHSDIDALKLVLCGAILSEPKNSPLTRIYVDTKPNLLYLIKEYRKNKNETNFKIELFLSSEKF